MLWACLSLPHLALDAVLRRHPEPDAPLALVRGTAPRRLVTAANAAALAGGVRRGQSLTAAEAVCPGLAVVEDDLAHHEHWQHFLAAWAYRYSSEVSTALPGAVVLEAEGSFGLHGPWPIFEARLRKDLVALGFRHRIALAPNAHAAWVLAGVADGLAVLQPETTHRALAAVPIEHARFSREVTAALTRIGLRTLGQVMALPRASLARRHGPAVLEHLDRLLGAPFVLPRYAPPDRFDLRIELSYEVEHTPALLFPLRRLTADLAAFLAGRDGGVQRFALALEHEGLPATVVEVGLLAPEREAAILFELARMRLERTAVPAPVRGLRLVARDLPPFVPAGRDLFDERPQQAVDWPHLRERLRARLGSDAVHTLAPTADHRPEHSQRQDLSISKHPWTPSASPRPTWLLSRPIPLRDPRLRVLAGPERIESGWWDGGDVQRDYYVLETSQGQQAWAFCAAGEAGPFMLHGWFA